jgi:hypothetical protein
LAAADRQCEQDCNRAAAFKTREGAVSTYSEELDSRFSGGNFWGLKRSPN